MDGILTHLRDSMTDDEQNRLCVYVREISDLLSGQSPNGPLIYSLSGDITHEMATYLVVAYSSKAGKAKIISNHDGNYLSIPTS